MPFEGDGLGIFEGIFVLPGLFLNLLKFFGAILLILLSTSNSHPEGRVGLSIMHLDDKRIQRLSGCRDYFHRELRQRCGQRSIARLGSSRSRGLFAL